MKHSFVIALMLASGFALTASAQTPSSAPAATAKTVVISFQSAVAHTNEGQRDLADIQKKFEPRTTELKALNEEIEKLQKDLQAQSATLSDADRASRVKTIEDKKKKFQRSAEDLRNDGNREVQQVLGEVGKKFYDVLVDYAKQQGYSVVLDAQEQKSDVIWAAEPVNIGQAVVDLYNTKSGIPAPAAPVAPAAKAPAAPKAPAAH
ncbi:MAG: OmpH family outer membrane protein [Terracidiphilus sp.]|jgi:outer membrane protein